MTADTHGAATDRPRERHPWWLGPAAVTGAGLILALGRTWRIAHVGLEHRDAVLAHDGRCIFALWHARLLPLIYTHRRWNATVLVSRHRDGELVARTIRHLGYQSARGSSTRGGEEGVRHMLRDAGDRRLLAITPDGPRGPAEQVKPGLVWLASQTGYPVLPVAAAAAHPWRLRSWDGFRIPRPMSRVWVGYGAPIAVPRALDPHQVELERGRIEAALRTLTSDLDRRAAEGT